MTQPIPRVAVLIDTSGSMSDGMLTQSVAEVHGVLKQIGNAAEVMVASCDAAVHKIQKVWSSKEVQLYGGGGTDIGVGIATIDAAKPKVDLLIIVTDCHTPWPEVKPKATYSLIINVGTGAPPSWGKTIKIEAEG
jgi:predicted metal-dependent peptidase